MNPPVPTATWSPSEAFLRATNIHWLMKRVGAKSCQELHAWTVAHRAAFWELVVERLQIRLRCPCQTMLDLADGLESPRWLVGAELNIVDSCFAAPLDSPAIVYQREDGLRRVMTVGELNALSNRVANGLVARGFKAGTAVAIDMPMTAESIAIYLGVLKAGCVAVSIADSFMPEEIAVRLKLGRAEAIFTQDVMVRDGKVLPMYERVVAANPPSAFVVPLSDERRVKLRKGDSWWAEFSSASDRFEVVSRQPDDHLHVLFSSGTTGEPKAIPWTQTTPIKCAMDAHFHHDIHPGDVLAWPTNLGWMMGPWLVFASLINRATMALYDGAPNDEGFGRFVQDARVTMLGVVPTLVKAWRTSGCMEPFDWSAIKLFSSTGECSNAECMTWLMSLAGNKPIIEYCGGTEIGGGYITGTVTRPSVPSTFNTAAFGLDFVILDEQGQPTDNGEVFLVPPSIGLSTELLTRNHHEVYYAGVPKGLRRHGDQLERLSDGYFRTHGRVDDTMNLSGIKISSREIEETVVSVNGVREAAAVAVNPPDGGPSWLVIFAVARRAASELKPEMQQAMRERLNPLFKIHDVVVVDSLPRTASNKVMRRGLRAQYENAL